MIRLTESTWTNRFNSLICKTLDYIWSFQVWRCEEEQQRWRADGEVIALVSSDGGLRQSSTVQGETWRNKFNWVGTFRKQSKLRGDDAESLWILLLSFFIQSSTGGLWLYWEWGVAEPACSPSSSSKCRSIPRQYLWNMLLSPTSSYLPLYAWEQLGRVHASMCFIKDWSKG